ncbi:hypothetical protein M758_UG241300 [Ceratodon purpureus]|nr:hypothetical protein M758_UG241300 [Ceratodon purpureus]
MAGALVRKAGSQSASGGARAWAAAFQEQESLLLGDHGDLRFEKSGGVRYSSSLAVSGSHRPVKRGTGGRSSVSGVVATVFGATEFLGRYVVQPLARMGSQVMVPYRGVDEVWRHLKLMGDLGQIVPMKYDAMDEDSIKAVIANSNVIVNCIEREYETRNFSFEDVNYGISNRISKLAKEHGGILKYVQMSYLPAAPHSSSRLLRSKHAAEEAVLQNIPEFAVRFRRSFRGCCRQCGSLMTGGRTREQVRVCLVKKRDGSDAESSFDMNRQQIEANQTNTLKLCTEKVLGLRPD